MNVLGRSIFAMGMLVGCTLAYQPGDLSSARRQFELHNYRAALAELDAYLSTQTNPTLEVGGLRARCLLKLRRWEDGRRAIEELFAKHAAAREQPELHMALADAGLRMHTHRHLAIEHFAAASELYLDRRDRESAAGAAIQCGLAFIRFSDWENFTLVSVDPPEDWRAGRLLQRRFAVEWLDRGIELTSDNARAAKATFRKAGLFLRELRHDDADTDVAINLYREVLSKWPDAKEAPNAALEIGRAVERNRQDYVAAVERYRFVIQRYPQSQAARTASRLLKNITSPILRVGVEGVTQPGAPVRIDYETRNISEIRFSAYRVDLFELIQEIGQLHKLDEWSPRGDAVATWSVAVPDTQEHKNYSSRSDGVSPTALPVSEPSAYVIVARSADASVQTSALTLITNLAAVSKGGKGSAFTWAVDSATGAAVADARVLIQAGGGNQYDYREAKTDGDGVVRVPAGGGKRRRNTASLYLQNGPHYAICNVAFSWYWWGGTGDQRLYAFTDRPVYRPDQVIHFKCVLRNHVAGDYQLAGRERLDLTLHDAKGEAVLERTLNTNEHGSVSGDLSLPSGAALGLYRLHFEINGKVVHGGAGAAFRVEEYRKPEFEVQVNAAQPRYDFGEPVDVRIETRYYFGSPVADASLAYTVHRAPMTPPVHYPIPYPWYFKQLGPVWSQRSGGCLPDYCRIPWERPRALVDRGELTTDADGVALLRITPEAGDEDGYRYTIDVEATDASRRTVTGSGSVNVTRAPFSLQLEPQRFLYQPKDRVHIDVRAVGPNGDPVSFSGRIRVHRLVQSKTGKKNASGGPELGPGEIVTDEALSANATGVTLFRWTADKKGPFRFIVTADSDTGVKVTAKTDLWVAETGGRYAHYAYRDIEIVPDRFIYQQGETARVLINTRFDEARVLLTVEADDLLDTRFVDLRGGAAVVELPIESMHTPNFFITATLVRDNKVYQDMQAVLVPPTQRFLSVTVEAESDTFSPQEQTQIAITAADHAGKPVDAELAVMLVDASLYAIQPEFRESVQEFFFGRTKEHTVATQTSFDLVSGPMRYERQRFAKGDMAMAGVKKAMPEGAAMAAMAESPQPAFAVAELRRDFPDSVVWIGHMDTGADGHATVDVRFPDTLTTWRLIAIAIDDETRVSEASKNLVTRKEVIARLAAPRFLVEHDSCTLTVIARNDLNVAKTMRVTLDVPASLTVGLARLGDSTIPFVAPNAVDVPVDARAEVAIDFDVLAQRVGTVTLKATVATDVSADALAIDLPVVAFGAQTFLADGGTMRDSDGMDERTISFTLPEKMNAETPVLEVHLNPTIAGVMLDAIPYLLDFPYGCTEQTMSRFLPAVVTRRTLDHLGVKLSDLASRMQTDPATDGRRRWTRNRHPVFNDGVLNDIVTTGLARLAEMQNGDGGWGWWKGSASDPYMSAYVVYGLAEAKRAKVAVDASVLSRGIQFLKRTIVDPARVGRRRDRSTTANTRVWMLYALSVDSASHLAESAIKAATDDAFTGRDELTDYSRAMLALVLHAASDAPRANTVVDNLENTAHSDDATQTASWGHAVGYSRWYDNGAETTAMVLRALLVVRPDHPRIMPAVNWLVRNREGARWHSTRETAYSIYALAQYLAFSRELDADMTVEVTYDNTVGRSFRINADNVLTFDARMIFAPKHLTPGDHEIRIEKQGRGTLYYASYVDFFTAQDPIEAAGHEVHIKRTYARLEPKEIERTRKIWDAVKRKLIEETYRAVDYDRVDIADGDAVASGDLIEVTLEIDARNAFEYISIEDPKPAGCEPVDLHSGYAWNRGLCSHIEFRDRHVAMFADYIPAGIHTVRYRLRCETPGDFGALPTQLRAMYSPYVRANSASRRVRVTP